MTERVPSGKRKTEVYGKNQIDFSNKDSKITLPFSSYEASFSPFFFLCVVHRHRLDPGIWGRKNRPPRINATHGLILEKEEKLTVGIPL